MSREHAIAAWQKWMKLPVEDRYRKSFEAAYDSLICPECNGTKLMKGIGYNNSVRCPTCNGKGWKEK